MPEFLVRFRPGEKYVRVQVRTVRHIERLFPHDCARVTAHRSWLLAYQLEVHRSSHQIRTWLPFGVYMAWLGARFPRVRLGVRLVGWFALGVLLTLLAWRSDVAAIWLVIVGLVNIFAWWWFECERGRLEPGVRTIRDW
jgi:hypothetical protein